MYIVDIQVKLFICIYYIHVSCYHYGYVYTVLFLHHIFDCRFHLLATTWDLCGFSCESVIYCCQYNSVSFVYILIIKTWTNRTKDFCMLLKRLVIYQNHIGIPYLIFSMYFNIYNVLLLNNYNDIWHWYFVTICTPISIVSLYIASAPPVLRNNGPLPCFQKYGFFQKWRDFVWNIR